MTTTKTTAKLAELAVLKLLAKGRSPQFVSEAVPDLTLGQVEAIAAKYGWPDQQKVQWAVDELTNDSSPRLPKREPGDVALAFTSTPPPPTSRPAPRPASSEATRPASAPAGDGPRMPATSPGSGGTQNGVMREPPMPTVEELVRACRRSEYKRTQNLGVKLAELADRIVATLREERESSERKALRALEIAAAQAEVKRLEAELAAARAKAVKAGASGGARLGPTPCPECGAELTSPQALGAHRRHKHGIQSTRTRSASA